jgi:malate dehydrogenase (oxaloacetate-decarboxylating)
MSEDDPMSDELFAKGDTIRREVLGNAHVDRSIANADPFAKVIQDYVTKNAWGEVWGREGLDRFKSWIARNTNATGFAGTLREGLAAADVFIGVSAPDLLTGADVATMAERAVVLALANPDPEVDPLEAQQHAMVVGTGRSDFPNQINNLLAFPGFFRGLLDAGAHEITDEMLVAAATAIADVVHPDELNPSYVVPSVFDPSVAPAVAAAVKSVADGVSAT